MKKISQTLIVKNELGLHARPAAFIARLLEKTSSKVLFTLESKTVDAKQILNLLLLGAKKMAEITIDVEGVDAFAIFEKLKSAFETQFGEA